MTHQRGFGIVGIVAIILVLAVAALVGYTVWNNYLAPDATTDQATSQQSATATDDSSSDIEAIAGDLDGTQLEDNSVEQLDAELTY